MEGERDRETSLHCGPMGLWDHLKPLLPPTARPSHSNGGKGVLWFPRTSLRSPGLARTQETNGATWDVGNYIALERWRFWSQPRSARHGTAQEDGTK